jgi:DNA polymerase elongation subunit (family B)
MKLLKLAPTNTEIESFQEIGEEENFFHVVKNHRQACIRRYLRKLRKERLREKKKQEERWVEEEERNRNDVLNMNMLGE